MSFYSGEFEGDRENKEKGQDVKIVLKFIRHGERTKDGVLTDYGRAVTRQRAQEMGHLKDEFDAIKAIGSNADPSEITGMGRSLETAHLYANELAGDEAFKTRQEQAISYQAATNPIPYDHRGIYNSYLPEDFEHLPDDEKASAAKTAQEATVKHALSLDTPEAIAYSREVAGGFAYVIDHYMRLAKRLKPDSQVLMPAGSHSPTMEYILKEALLRRDKEGKWVHGFNDISEIGGPMNPSEAYNVEVATDENGEYKLLSVSFDNPERPQEEMYLDWSKVAELRDYYKELHPETV